MTHRQQGVRHMYVLRLLILKDEPAVPIDPRKCMFHEHTFTVLSPDIATPTTHDAWQEATCISSGSVAPRVIATICKDIDTT